MKIMLVIVGVFGPTFFGFLLVLIISSIEGYKRDKLDWEFDNIERERYGLAPISFKEWKFWRKLRQMGLKYY